MNFKRRGNSISLYRSTWVPKGPGVPHGYTCQNYVGTIQADALNLPTDLAKKLSPAECAALERRVLGPARLAHEEATRRARLREADPRWRLDEALRLVNEAVERSQDAAVTASVTQSIKSAVEKVKTIGSSTTYDKTQAPDALREAHRAITAAATAVRSGQYGRGPENGFRKTSVYRQWTEIQQAVDGSEQSLLRALQDAGYASRRMR